MPINGKPKDMSRGPWPSSVQQILERCVPGLAPNPEHCECFAEIGGEECALVRSGGRLELESAAYERCKMNQDGQLTE